MKRILGWFHDTFIAAEGLGPGVFWLGILLCAGGGIAWYKAPDTSVCGDCQGRRDTVIPALWAFDNAVLALDVADERLGYAISEQQKALEALRALEVEARGGRKSHPILRDE